MLIVSPETARVLDCNKAASHCLGFSRPELLKTAITGICSEITDSSLWEKQVSRLKKTGHLVTQCSYKRKGGGLLPVELTSNYVEQGIKKGRPDALIIITVRDVSGRIMVQRAMIDSEEKFRVLAEVSANAVTNAVIQINEKGETVYWSKAAERIFGYSFGEMHGRPLHSVLLPPALCERYEKGFEEFAKTGKGHGIGRVMELTALRKDGVEIPVEISLSALNLDGKWNAVGIIKDVTQKKNTLTALQENMERFRHVFEEGPLGMAVTGLDGEIIKANAVFCNLLGYSEEELANGFTFMEVTHPDDLTANVFELEKLLDGDIPFFTMQKRYLAKGGETVWASLTVSLIRDRENKPQYFLSMVEDITDKVRLESIAGTIESMNNMGYIFSGLRHEIGNPVNALKMTLNVLKSRLGNIPPESVAEYVERAIGEVSRIESILWTLKSFNMYESMDIKPVHMRSFISDFISMVRLDAEQKGIAISADVMPGAEYALADPRALQQVLMNLITNSMDALAGRKAPLISITVSRSGTGTEITVADNGAGMDEKQLSELFRPFRTSKAKGTGLGLVISRKMLAGMNGTIDIQSRKGEGTSARMVIPPPLEKDQPV